MIVIRGSNPSKDVLNILKAKTKNQQMAVTIGNFDGLHQGHRYIFDKLFKLADQQNLSKVLITFEPRPEDYFAKKHNKASVGKHSRLTLLSDKLFLLKTLGFDLVWVMNFNQTIADMPAQEFLNKIHSVLDIKALLVGCDFRFGKNRTGNAELLQDFSANNGLIFEAISDYVIDNQRVSSSRIRDLLSGLDFGAETLDLVGSYLTRYYGFSGRVMFGQRAGRTLGYPTVNINVKPRQLLLPRGVYAVNILIDHKKYQGMANWGVRPTIAKTLDLVLEAHIFDFAKEIYGHKISIEFLAKIRNEQKFNSITELKEQLAADFESVTNFFNS